MGIRLKVFSDGWVSVLHDPFERCFVDESLNGILRAVIAVNDIVVADLTKRIHSAVDTYQHQDIVNQLVKLREVVRSQSRYLAKALAA